MTAKGHLLVASPIAIAIAAHYELHGNIFVAFFGLFMLGALFPDIDEPNSFIGRKLSFLSIPIRILSYIFPSLEHRGITHILLFSLPIIILGYHFGSLWVFAFGFGCLAHTIGDLLTKGGIKNFFFPLSNSTARLLPKDIAFYTASPAEFMVMAMLAVINVALFYYFGLPLLYQLS